MLQLANHCVFKCYPICELPEQVILIQTYLKICYLLANLFSLIRELKHHLQLRILEIFNRIVVPFSINLVEPPPSQWKTAGITSDNSNITFKTPVFCRTFAEHSIFTPLFKSFPKNSLTTALAFGNLVEPPNHDNFLNFHLYLNHIFNAVLM